MKKLLTAWMLLIAVIGHAQKTKPTGLGPFKIGMSQKVFLDTMSRVFKKVHDMDDPGKATQRGIYKAVKPAQGVTNKYYTSCKNAQVYYLPTYTIASIEFKKIVLKFLNDELISIQTDFGPEIREALDLKYGKATPKIDKVTIRCTDPRSGTQIEREEKVTSVYWTKKTDQVFCYATMHTFYNDQCQEKATSYLSMSKKGASSALAQCNLDTRKMMREENTKLRAAKLSDL